MIFNYLIHEIFVRWVRITTIVMTVLLVSTTFVSATALKIVVLGDSLVAGYGLAPGAAFPERLEKLLVEAGIDAKIVNAGVSGDTSANGLARLDWSVPADTDAVIVELGANDALRGLSPKITEKNLSDIIQKLESRGIEVMLVGMKAPPNLGQDYVDKFDAIYPTLAQTYELAFYPFFLDGVAAVRELNQADGIHPTAEGIDLIATQFFPFAQTFIDNVRSQKTDEGS